MPLKEVWRDAWHGDPSTVDSLNIPPPADVNENI
jgi:hypothetical protein